MTHQIKRKIWEYKKTEGEPYGNMLKELGEQGWELCGIITGNQYTATYAYWKREKIGNK